MTFPGHELAGPDVVDSVVRQHYHRQAFPVQDDAAVREAEVKVVEDCLSAVLPPVSGLTLFCRNFAR